MSKPIIEVSNLSKCYHLGSVGARTMRDELEILWNRLCGQGLESEKQGVEKGKVKEDRDFWALKDVSFQVEPGEVLGIIGRNGAGKSTLLKILSRITEPTSGEMVLRGRVASLLEVGTGFHPELSGRENIFLNGAILGMRKWEIDHKFDEIVAFAEVERYIDTPVKRYSSGMYVRLAFAVAAHLEPEILVVDEVLAVGDAEFQKKCLGKMKDVAGHGRTIFFVSHNMSAIRQLCDKAMLLEKGKIVLMGKTEQVAEEYLSRSYSEVFKPKANGYSKPHFSNVALLNKDGAKIGIVRAGEKAFLSIQIETMNSRRLIFGMTIFNSDDVGVFSSVSSDTCEFIPVTAKIITIEIPTAFLNAGMYRFEGVLSEDGVCLENSECYLKFEIHRGGAFDLAGGKPKGLLRLPETWSFT